MRLLYRLYLWSFGRNGTANIFAVSERIVEYPFAIKTITQLPKSSRVAVVGCHGDLLTTILPSLGYETHGIDVKAFPLEFENFRFWQADIRRTDFPEGYFDAIVAISTIEHIGMFDGDPNGDQRAMAEMRRILKPDGICVITVPFARERASIAMKQRIYDRRSLEDLLAGLKIDRMSVYAARNGELWKPINVENAPDPRTVTECAALVCAVKTAPEH